MKRSELPDGATVFDNLEFDDALIGEDLDGRAVYDYWGMIDLLIERENMTPEYAIDYLENNVVGLLPYMGEMAPILVMLDE